MNENCIKQCSTSTKTLNIQHGNILKHGKYFLNESSTKAECPHFHHIDLQKSFYIQERLIIPNHELFLHCDRT
jgi:hypothetical protein